MYLHVERWTARSAWLALSLRDRIHYLDQMGPSFQSLTASGARLIGTVLRDDGASSDGVQYLAVWAMPEGPSQVQLLEEVLDAFGWEDYFRPTTDRRAARTPETFFEYARNGLNGTPGPSARRT